VTALVLVAACATITPPDRLRELVEPWIGTPYRAGGSTTTGTDCSGFTQAVMAELGVTVPRRSRDQAKVGRRIDRSELQPGDLVLFDLRKSPGIDHVGIYTGDGTFVHASRQQGVVIDRLDAPAYRRGYRGARRVLE
jgi:cell wall-associated NlpC family hydrolase